MHDLSGAVCEHTILSWPLFPSSAGVNEEGAALAKTKQWTGDIKLYFPIASWHLRSEAQTNKPTHPHGPAGRCPIVGFSVNAAKAHTSSCLLCVSLLCVCVAQPRLKANKHTDLQLFFTSMTDRRAEEGDGDSDVTWSLWFHSGPTSRCYWLGAIHPLPKEKKIQTEGLSRYRQIHTGFFKSLYTLSCV